MIGHPIGHSKSPIIHNYWIAKYERAGLYEAIDIAPDDLHDGVQGLIKDGYAGFNATIPHKEALLTLCDTLDPIAKSCGAVNTVVIRDGYLHGYNTDAFGFLENIRAYKPDFDFTAGPAVVLGAGGAARAIIAGLINENAPIILTNRTREKAEILAREITQNAGQGGAVTIVDWKDRHNALSGVNVLVNTTSLGMVGQAALEIALDQLPQTALVTDIVYSPLETDLLKRAKERGHPIVTGIGMLLHQARPGFEKWHGVMPDVSKFLEDLVLK